MEQPADSSVASVPAVIAEAKMELDAIKNVCPVCRKVCKSEQGLKAHQSLTKHFPTSTPQHDVSAAPPDPADKSGSAAPPAVLPEEMLGHVCAGLGGSFAILTGCDELNLDETERKIAARGLYPLYLKNAKHPFFQNMEEITAGLVTVGIAAKKVRVYREWKQKQPPKKKIIDLQPTKPTE